MAKEMFARNPQEAMTFLNEIDPFFELGSAVVMDAALRDGIARLEPIIRKSIESDPESSLNSPELVHDIADYLLEKRRTDEAIELFRFNISEHPKSAIAYDRLGRAYRKLGQYGLARKSYEKALEVDPNYWNADTAKQRIHELTKKVSPESKH